MNAEELLLLKINDNWEEAEQKIKQELSLSNNNLIINIFLIDFVLLSF